MIHTQRGVCVELQQTEEVFGNSILVLLKINQLLFSKLISFITY